MNGGLGQLDQLRSSDRTLRESLARRETERDAASSKASGMSTRLQAIEDELAITSTALRRSKREPDEALTDGDTARSDRDALDKSTKESRSQTDAFAAECDDQKESAASLHKQLSEARVQGKAFEDTFTEYKSRVGILTAEKRALAVQGDATHA